MFSLPTPQRNIHEARELHDCGHTTIHPCLNPNQGNAKTHECTFRVPIEEHGQGVRRLCPTCTFALATQNENNPGAMKKWWKEDSYIMYMEDSFETDNVETNTVKKTVALNRSIAIKGGIPGLRSRPQTPLIRSTSVHPDTNPLFGTPPSRDRVPAPAKEAKTVEGKETEAKKPSRIASVKSSLKKLLSFRKKPAKEEPLEKKPIEDEDDEELFQGALRSSLKTWGRNADKEGQ